MAYQYMFLDPALPLKERVQDLISRLTLEEKAGFIPSGNQAVERLGIKAWSVGAEGAHGFVDRDGNNTTFPQTIGLASTWDRDILRRVGEAAAVEARVYCKTHDNKGGLAIWSPTIDLERDPRWGRTEEGYGEDPFLTGMLSYAYIRGAQGDDPFYLRVSCGPKHFFANNNEKNRGSCSCSIPLRCMYEYYLAPFKTAIQDAKAVSLMTAYNEVNGIPMLLHPMLNDIVKNKWGLEGHIVTDGGDFLQTVSLHHYFETHAETLAQALKNGADTMTDSSENAIPAVMEALEKKYLTEAELDEHVARILSIRFRFGHFDPPGLCPYDAIDESDHMKDEYRALSLESVKKSAVLLKNEGGMLPLLPEKQQSVAVIGPLANAVHLDWYSGVPTYLNTALDGMREMYGKDKIVHADFRDLVSFTTQDGKPLVLLDAGHPKGKLLSVGKPGQSPARFYKEDWGWGSYTLTDEESDLLLESAFWRKEPGGSDFFGDDLTIEKNIVTASGKNTYSWFGFSIFNLVPQENGLTVLRTFDNRRVCISGEVTAAGGATPVFLNDDLVPTAGELFKMKIEKEGLPAAIEAAAKADKVIFVAGNNPMVNGRECVDRPSLDLPPFQEEFINKVYEVNPKMTLVLISGYPFTLKETAKKIPAILWMAPGMQETGRGLASVISGIYSPAGRLSLTWYEDESQLPSIMEYDIISAGTTYQYFKGQVLYPFGHGLSYSSFIYSQLNIDKTSANENDTVAVSFKIKNTGSMIADEVSQVYVTVSASVRSPVVRPLKTLKGFDRISLAPGEERLVSFNLPVKELAFWDSFNGRFCVEEGECKVSVGASSADIRLTGNFKVHGETFALRKITGQIYAERFDEYADCYLHEKRGSDIAAVFNNVCEGACKGWIRFAALDFSQGFANFSAIVQGNPGSRIEIRLDAPDGELAGTIDVPNTGETLGYELNPLSPRRRQLWTFAKTAIKKITGVHDLYLVLHGKTGIWRFNFN